MSDLGGDPACWTHLFEPDEGRSPEVVVADSLGIDVPGGSGAFWHLPHGGDLDANLVYLRAGDRIGAHVNDEVDVLICVVGGAGDLIVGDETHPLHPGRVASVPKGRRRGIAASAEGLTYLSVHRRRTGPRIVPKPGRA